MLLLPRGPVRDGTMRKAPFAYQAYLASREWALLKRQVRERSGGKCERCGADQEATHHLTYERIGEERLEDLQAVCNACHEYLSGLSDIDPTELDPTWEPGLYVGMGGRRDQSPADWPTMWGRVVSVLMKAHAYPEHRDANGLQPCHCAGYPVYLSCFGLDMKVHFPVHVSEKLRADLKELVGECDVIFVSYDGEPV